MKDPTALNTLLLALYYSALPDAEAAIHSMAHAQTAPAEVRERAKLMEGRIAEAHKTEPGKVREWIKQNEVAIAPDATEKELRDGRRKRRRAISDEALMELDIYTLPIYQARTK